MDNSSSIKTKLPPMYQQLNLMNPCQIYKLEILQLFLNLEIKLSPTASKTTLQLRQKTIIIRPSLLEMTSG